MYPTTDTEGRVTLSVPGSTSTTVCYDGPEEMVAALEAAANRVRCQHLLPGARMTATHEDLFDDDGRAAIVIVENRAGCVLVEVYGTTRCYQLRVGLFENVEPIEAAASGARLDG